MFVGLVEEIYPKNLKAYGRQWRRMYREDLPNEWISTESSVEKLRDFILRLWAPIYSTEERRLLNSARSLDELDEAMPGFWITPRRIRLKIIELFAGPGTRKIVLYTGLAHGDCGVDFQVGEQWHVDGFRDDSGRWIARMSTGTSPVSQAAEVLQSLRARKPDK